MRIIRDSLILLLLVLLVWMAFSYFSETSRADELVSVQKEQELAEKFEDYMFSSFMLIEDDSIADALNIIKQRLVIHDSGLAALNIKLHLLDESNVNAFTSLGGNIYIFSGLLRAVKGPEELAAVLAHEIAHAEKRHVMKKLIREIGVNSLLMIISGGDPIMMEQIGKMLMSASFDRAMEKEADERAVAILYNARINPNRLAHFFMYLKNEKRSYVQWEWINSHPDLKKRIENVLQLSAEKESLSEQPFDIAWEAIKERLP